jgi:hypothetical protein
MCHSPWGSSVQRSALWFCTSVNEMPKTRNGDQRNLDLPPEINVVTCCSVSVHMSQLIKWPDNCIVWPSKATQRTATQGRANPLYMCKCCVHFVLMLWPTVGLSVAISPKESLEGCWCAGCHFVVLSVSGSGPCPVSCKFNLQELSLRRWLVVARQVAHEQIQLSIRLLFRSGDLSDGSNAARWFKTPAGSCNGLLA